MKMCFPRLLLFFSVGCCFSPAHALELELSIKGSPEEIVGILELLQERGIGQAPEASAPEEGVMRFELQSVLEGDAGAAEADAEAPPEQDPQPAPPPPALRLENPAVVPEEVAPGSVVVVSVLAVDEAHAIDTMSASIQGTDTTIDLFDNGTQGDAAANDGQWSGTLEIASDAGPRGQRVEIRAYDADGQPLTENLEGERPLTARTRFQIMKAAPAEETPAEAKAAEEAPPAEEGSAEPENAAPDQPEETAPAAPAGGA